MNRNLFSISNLAVSLCCLSLLGCGDSDPDTTASPSEAQKEVTQAVQTPALKQEQELRSRIDEAQEDLDASRELLDDVNSQRRQDQLASTEEDIQRRINKAYEDLDQLNALEVEEKTDEWKKQYNSLESKVDEIAEDVANFGRQAIKFSRDKDEDEFDLDQVLSNLKKRSEMASEYRDDLKQAEDKLADLTTQIAELQADAQKPAGDAATEIQALINEVRNNVDDFRNDRDIFNFDEEFASDIEDQVKDVEAKIEEFQKVYELYPEGREGDNE